MRISQISDKLNKKIEKEAFAAIFFIFGTRFQNVSDKNENEEGDEQECERKEKGIFLWTRSRRERMNVELGRKFVKIPREN